MRYANAAGGSQPPHQQPMTSYGQHWQPQVVPPSLMPWGNHPQQHQSSAPQYGGYGHNVTVPQFQPPVQRQPGPNTSSCPPPPFQQQPHIPAPPNRPPSYFPAPSHQPQQQQHYHPPLVPPYYAHNHQMPQRPPPSQTPRYYDAPWTAADNNRSSSEYGPPMHYKSQQQQPTHGGTDFAADVPQQSHNESLPLPPDFRRPSQFGALPNETGALPGILSAGSMDNWITTPSRTESQNLNHSMVEPFAENMETCKVDSQNAAVAIGSPPPVRDVPRRSVDEGQVPDRFWEVVSRPGPSEEVQCAVELAANSVAPISDGPPLFSDSCPEPLLSQSGAGFVEPAKDDDSAEVAEMKVVDWSHIPQNAESARDILTGGAEDYLDDAPSVKGPQHSVVDQGGKSDDSTDLYPPPSDISVRRESVASSLTGRPSSTAQLDRSSILAAAGSVGSFPPSPRRLSTDDVSQSDRLRLTADSPHPITAPPASYFSEDAQVLDTAPPTHSAVVDRQTIDVPAPKSGLPLEPHPRVPLEEDTIAIAATNPVRGPLPPPPQVASPGATRSFFAAGGKPPHLSPGHFKREWQTPFAEASAAGVPRPPEGSTRVPPPPMPLPSSPEPSNVVPHAVPTPANEATLNRPSPQLVGVNVPRSTGDHLPPPQQQPPPLSRTGLPLQQYSQQYESSQSAPSFQKQQPQYSQQPPRSTRYSEAQQHEEPQQYEERQQHFLPAESDSRLQTRVAHSGANSHPVSRPPFSEKMDGEQSTTMQQVDVNSIVSAPPPLDPQKQRQGSFSSGQPFPPQPPTSNAKGLREASETAFYRGFHPATKGALTGASLFATATSEAVRDQTEHPVRGAAHSSASQRNAPQNDQSALPSDMSTSTIHTQVGPMDASNDPSYVVPIAVNLRGEIFSFVRQNDTWSPVAGIAGAAQALLRSLCGPLNHQNAEDMMRLCDWFLDAEMGEAIKKRTELSQDLFATGLTYALFKRILHASNSAPRWSDDDVLAWLADLETFGDLLGLKPNGLPRISAKAPSTLPSSSHALQPPPSTQPRDSGPSNESGSVWPQICRQVCCGCTQEAIELSKQHNLWAEAFALAPLAVPDTYSKLQRDFTAYIGKSLAPPSQLLNSGLMTLNEEVEQPSASVWIACVAMVLHLQSTKIALTPEDVFAAEAALVNQISSTPVLLQHWNTVLRVVVTTLHMAHPTTRLFIRALGTVLATDCTKRFLGHHLLYIGGALPSLEGSPPDAIHLLLDSGNPAFTPPDKVVEFVQNGKRGFVYFDLRAFLMTEMLEQCMVLRGSNCRLKPLDAYSILVALVLKATGENNRADRYFERAVENPELHTVLQAIDPAGAKSRISPPAASSLVGLFTKALF